MKHSKEKITLAATRDGGLCLSCGEIQPFLQYQMPFSPCRSCGHWHVLHAKAVLKVFSLVRDTPPLVGHAIKAHNDENLLRG